MPDFKDARTACRLSLAFGIVGLIAASAQDDQSVTARKYRPVLTKHEHYYPTTGVKPKVGRDEDLSAPTSATPAPDTTYSRKY